MHGRDQRSIKISNTTKTCTKRNPAPKFSSELLLDCFPSFVKMMLNSGLASLIFISLLSFSNIHIWAKTDQYVVFFRTGCISRKLEGK